MVDYFEEASRIWRECVPQSGQSDTVEGELLRAVEKLREEATRNGNGNWDDGFVILLRYLREKLIDQQLFSAPQIAEIEQILASLATFEQPVLDDAPYDCLADRVVDHFVRYGSQPHSRNPGLWR